MILLIVFSIFLIWYIISRVFCGRCDSNTCLVGKTAIVTGGNAGLGYETVLDLASRGCKVIIADKDDCSESIKKIINETGNHNIFAKHLDLASFKSVRQFANKILNTEARLDILVNNAGMAAHIDRYTEDGLQITMQVNYFGPFLLTTLLIGLLKKSTPSRIVFVSSSMAFFNDLTLDNMNPSSSYKDTTLFKSGFYSNSKLCVLIAAQVFAEKLKRTGIICNSLHPGGCKTNILRAGYKLDGKYNLLLLSFFLFFFGKTAREGAQTTIHLAVSKDVENTSGEHFWDCVRFFVPSKAKDREFCERVWKLSEDFVKLSQDEKI